MGKHVEKEHKTEQVLDLIVVSEYVHINFVRDQTLPLFLYSGEEDECLFSGIDIEI